MLIAATNEHFFDQYPAAPPHLDPNDPGQQLYVMEWVRIRDQILGDGVTEFEQRLVGDHERGAGTGDVRRTVGGAVRPGGESRS